MDDITRKSVKGESNQFFNLQEFTIPNKKDAEEPPPQTLGEAPMMS